MTKPSRLGIGRWKLALLAALLVSVSTLAGQQPTAPPAPQQPSEIATVISGSGAGQVPNYAVPDFVAVNPDVNDVAKMLGQIVWNDIDFEREVHMIARDVAATVPVARTADQVPFPAWRELNADAVLFGSVQKTGNNLTVQVRLFDARTRQAVFSTEYTGPDRNPRAFAHHAANDILLQQRKLHGSAQTRLAFVSSRERTRVRGTGQRNREGKEIWISDYDGANQTRVTVASQWLNLGPSWSPDGRAIAYTSYERESSGGAPDIFISRINQGTRENPTRGKTESNFAPVFSPNGSRIAFWSSRDGNGEIYVVNVDGSGLKRLTFSPSYESGPTWSPDGAKIAFTSDRTGSPQIWTMNADGSSQRKLTSEPWADRTTWAPAPYNEIAFAAGPQTGFDIKVYDFDTSEIRALTHGEGTNESPSYSPNGRHIAFMSTRKGNKQIFTMTRDGRDVRQVTTAGTNEMPSWSH
jgi:TolB protein